MILIKENVLNKYNNTGNECFKVSDDPSFGGISINSTCHEVLASRILNAFESFGFSPSVVKRCSVIGSSITPLSSNDSTVDLIVVPDKNLFYDQVRDKLYSDGIIDEIIRSNKSLSDICFSSFPEEEVFERLVYAVRPYIVKTINSKKILNNGKMSARYVIEPNDDFLNENNNFTIIEDGLRVAKFNQINKFGYIDFVKDVNKKQYYKLVVKPLYAMFNDYKKILKYISENKKLDDSVDENVLRLKSAFDMFSNNRFGEDSFVRWKDDNGNEILNGRNGKSLDYSGVYSYVNVLYQHVNKDLLSPDNESFGIYKLLRLINSGFEDCSSEEVVRSARQALDTYGKFEPKSFLSKKFERFKK